MRPLAARRPAVVATTCNTPRFSHNAPPHSCHLGTPPLSWCQRRCDSTFSVTTTTPGAAAAAASRGVAVKAAKSQQQPVVSDSVQLTMTSNLPPILERPLVVLFGDSLTQYSLDPEGGWGAALAHHMQRRADIISRGHSGYNTRWALPVFDQVLKQQQGQKVLLLTIWLGANDAAIPDRSAKRQHVPLSEFTANLKQMVAKAQAADNIANIVLLTPPPVNDEGRIKHQQQKMSITTPVPPDRTLAYMQPYAAAVADIGKQAGVPVVDLFNRLQAVPGWQTQLLKDGLHFTPAGSMAVWQELREVLEAQLPQVSPDKLPAQFPMWDAPDVESYWNQTRPSS